MSIAMVNEILGGEKILGQTICDQMGLYKLGKQGVSKAALMRLGAFMGLSLSQLADILPVTERTIQRYSSNQSFNSYVSEHILHLAELLSRGMEVFENKDHFLLWLEQPSTALGDRTPKSMFASRFGIEMVMDELTRMEYGVFS
ncbi:MAG: antitoxin Xre/MbcA/ParS toxin-binding domain-containing protein [Candidatus Sumerlaeia bacterium]